MKPGSLQGLFLVVEYIEATGNDLISRGVEVSEIWHIAPGKGRVPGLDPQRRSYFSRASFADPDGNTWILQEITERLPGRVRDSGTLAQLLRETAEHHGSFEAVAPPYDWWDWYGAYVDAREQGLTPDEASAAAGRLHGRHQAHRRRIRLTPLLIAAWRPRPRPGSPARLLEDRRRDVHQTPPRRPSPPPPERARRDHDTPRTQTMQEPPYLAKATRSARFAGVSGNRAGSVRGSVWGAPG